MIQQETKTIVMAFMVLVVVRGLTTNIIITLSITVVEQTVIMEQFIAQVVLVLVVLRF